MSLTLDDLGRIAHLARLAPNAAQAERMLVPINALFDLVEKMRAVDTSGVEPLAHPLASVRAVALRLADDVASAPDCRDANQQSAPLVERGLFLVPRVIE